MRDTSVAQPLLFAIQVAMVMALRTAGVQPDACMGHSVGEVAAAWASGALTLDQASRVIAVRSRLQARTAGVGRMAVLGLGAAAAAEAVAGTEVEVAAHNSSGATTLAGPEAALQALGGRAKEAGWAFTLLDLDYAFHSAAMDPIRDALARELAGLVPGPATLPFVSTVAGGPADGTTLGAEYWWRNVRAPVRFAEAAAHLVASGVRVFIEVGPQPVLQAYLHDALTAADAAGRVLPTLSRRTASADPVLLTAGRAHAAGCDIRRAPAFSGPRRTDALPAYPWQREPHWLGRTVEAVAVADAPEEHPLLGIRRGAEPMEWSAHLGTAPHPWLADHAVGGATVAPCRGAGGDGAGRRPRPPSRRVRAGGVGPGDQPPPGVRARRAARGAPARRHSRRRVRDHVPGCGCRMSLGPSHATGRIGAGESAAPARDAPPVEAMPRTLDGPALYALAGGLGLAYGPAFQVVQRVEIGRDTALVRFAPGAQDAALQHGAFLLPPPLMDGALQGLLALAAGKLGDGDGVLPWRFGRVRLLAPGGAVPAAARLHVTRVGPRSVRTDIALLDAAGAVVAELLDCWFVRVALGRAAAPEERLFHTAMVPSATGAAPALAADVLGEDAGEPGEAGILADAFAALAAAAALRQVLPDPAASFTAGQLVQDGVVAPAMRERLDEVLGWLAADGLADVQDGAWTLLEDELSADDVLRTLVFDQPRAVADAALLAAAAERLAAELRGAPAPAAPAALLDGMLLGSPAGAAAADALLDAVMRVAEAWPAGQPLRVLEVGARRGAFTRMMLRRLSALPVEMRLDAATGPDDVGALGEALAGTPGASARTWDAVAGRAPYDMIVGLHPLALGALESGLAAPTGAAGPGRAGAAGGAGARTGVGPGAPGRPAAARRARLDAGAGCCRPVWGSVPPGFGKLAGDPDACPRPCRPCAGGGRRGCGAAGACVAAGRCNRRRAGVGRAARHPACAGGRPAPGLGAQARHGAPPCRAARGRRSRRHAGPDGAGGAGDAGRDPDRPCRG